MDREAQIVVLGAGVVGLTTALQLARSGYKNVAVVSKYFAGDSHPEYTSRWAAVNFHPVSKEGSEAAQWDKESWPELYKLAKDVPAAGVKLSNNTSYFRNKDRPRDQYNDWWSNLVLDHRILRDDEIPPFADWGIAFCSIALDPPIYLHYLQSTCLALGVKFHRASVDHIRDAFSLDVSSAFPHPELVVNCTGVWSAKLGGVTDSKIMPVRGQIVLVENDSHGEWALSGDDDMAPRIGECCYIVPRPSGGGTALGGCRHIGWSTEPDMALAERIMKRAIKVCPKLVPPGAGIEALRVVRHQVGLRPLRMGGPRIEMETLPDGGEKVVHCYGAGGFGFQSSYGMANKAVRLVGESLATKARL